MANYAGTPLFHRQSQPIGLIFVQSPYRLVFDKAFVRPQIAHFLLDLRHKLSSCYRIIAAQLNALKVLL
jgi:hypothetical protein